MWVSLPARGVSPNELVTRIQMFGASYITNVHGRFSSQRRALSITLVVVPPFFAPYQLLLRKLARYRFMSPCSQLRFRAPVEKAVLLIVVAALSGCDVPTSLPIFDVRWVIPVEETSISVVELLPTDVTVVGGNFEVTNVADVVLSQTLDVLCPDCIPFNGLTVDKPLFNLVYNQSGSLPADVVSVELVNASISLAMQNDLGFDPIRPAVAAPGTMTITIHAVDATGPELGRVVLDGNVATDSVPDGALTTVSLPL